MFDSSFLCLDIGSAGVRGIAHRVRSARLAKSAVYAVDSFDTVFAIKSVVDELERQIGTHFDRAYITGDYGPAIYDMIAKNDVWNGEHKITVTDLQNQIAHITPPAGYFSMHLVPLRYDTPGARDIRTPIGHIDRQLISRFGAIYYSHAGMNDMQSMLRRAHIQAESFFAPAFLHNATMRPQHTTTMFIDLGAKYTTASIWTDRGPVALAKIGHGGTDISTDIGNKLNTDFDDAERIKRAVASVATREMDRFTPADAGYGFSRADVNEIVLAHMVDILANLRTAIGDKIDRYKPASITLTGGGSEIDSIAEFFENTFGLPVRAAGRDATVRSLAEHIWALNAAHASAYIARQERWARRIDSLQRIFHMPRRRPRRRIIPIMPSSLCFDMQRDETYSLFRAGDISMIHVDIMDGLYVDRIAGSIAELKKIRSKTSARLHVHLMTESPDFWATDAVAAGADTVIVSTNTSGVRAALRTVRAAGRRCGIALNPDTPISILKPILRDLDEVMVMSVTPGAAGQTFQTDALAKIATLAATRRKYNLKFKISVDGGINPETAQKCWAAGADTLVCGSYLARASDFPLAVRSLLRNNTKKSTDGSRNEKIA